jgi:hypothetical protein
VSNDVGWRAYVEHDLGAVRRGIAVHLAERCDGGLLIVKPADLTQALIEGDAACMTHPPALRMPDEMARALLDALSAHYGGTSDTRTLRSDLLHERGRVDKVTGALIDALLQRRPA